MRSKSIISSNAATKSSRCLLADKRMLKELCSCNEHGETEGFEVGNHEQEDAGKMYNSGGSLLWERLQLVMTQGKFRLAVR